MPYIDETRLDDAADLELRDSRRALWSLATAGAQVRQQVTLTLEAGAEGLARIDSPRAVLVAAMGGSRIVGDVLAMLAEQGSPVPVHAVENLPLPGWVGPMDLVVAVSVSGRAQGPLAIAAEAARRGAQLLTVGAAGSPLAEVCERARGVHVPLGRGPSPSSRTGLWSMLTPVLMAAHRLRLVDVPDAALEQVADRLDEVAEECRPRSESFVNPAKMLAVQLAETVPAVLAQSPLTGVAGLRAADALMRTARMPAVCGQLPDSAGHVVALLDGPFTCGGGEGAPDGGAPGLRGRTADDIFADPFLDAPAQAQLGLLLVRDARPEWLGEDGAQPGDPRVEPALLREFALMDRVAALAHEAGARVMEVQARPGAPVVRLAGLMATTDFATTYLALGLGLDPGVSRHLDELRDRAR